MLKIIAIVVVATIIGIVAMNFIPALSGGGGRSLVYVEKGLF